MPRTIVHDDDAVTVAVEIAVNEQTCFGKCFFVYFSSCDILIFKDERTVFGFFFRLSHEEFHRPSTITKPTGGIDTRCKTKDDLRRAKLTDLHSGAFDERFNAGTSVFIDLL